MVAALLVLSTAPAAAFAQMGPAPPPDLDPATRTPRVLEKVGIDQKIGEHLPLDATFRDENGHTVKLGDYFGHRPVVMALAYYECPMLCTQVLNGMTGSLKTMSFDAGKDFDVVVISINPRETPSLAKEKKDVYVKHYGRPETAAGWHFLVGSDDQIHRVANAIGFHYAYDKNIDQYAHAAAIYVTTPSGIIARYLLGIDFAPKDLRYALVEASNNRLGTVVDQVLLYCYHYDPSTGRYGADTLLAVRIGFIATVLAFLTFLFVSLRRERHQADGHLANRI
jgi:protein SCO1/2